jgi:hypothetical protein
MFSSREIYAEYGTICGSINDKYNAVCLPKLCTHVNNINVATSILAVRICVQ